MEAGGLGIGKSAEPYSTDRFADAKSVASVGCLAGDETFAQRKINSSSEGHASHEVISGGEAFGGRETARREDFKHAEAAATTAANQQQKALANKG